MEIVQALGDESRLELSPAIKSADGKPLTQEEFQQLLYDYFEEKGILTDMRAHLRSQMVSLLRDTGLSRLATLHSDISPKLQALNLLLAEFLHHHRFHYTLSVFTTEAPLSRAFSHDFPDFRFPPPDLQDILDTLSIPQLQQTSATADYNSSNQPLLQCLLKPPPTSTTSSNLESFIDFLKSSQTPPETTLKIIQHLKSLITTEMQQLDKEKTEEISDLKRLHQQETSKLEEKLSRKLQSLQKSHEKDQKRLQTELESAKANLKVCAQNLQGKYRDLQKFEEDLREREDRVRGREEALGEKEAQLQKQLDVLAVQVERFGGKELQEKGGGAQDGGSSKQQEKSLENMSVENALLKTNVLDLQVRVGTLCEQNRIYLNRIQDLAVRTTGLMQELESSQQKVQELNGSRRQEAATFRPLVPPDVEVDTRRTKYGIASYNGGGEEGSTVPPLSPRHFRHADLKRKKPAKSRTASSTPSTSDDTGPTATDAVLREARQRLLDLQHESRQIDRHFRAIPADGRALADFHLNVAAIRNNLSKIFHRQYPFPGHSPQFIPVNENILYTSRDHQKCSDDEDRNTRRRFGQQGEEDTSPRRFQEENTKRRMFQSSEEERSRPRMFEEDSRVFQGSEETNRPRIFTEDSRLFQGSEDTNRPRMFEEDEVDRLRMFCGNEDRLRIKNLIADLPVRTNNFEYLVEVGAKSEESGRSSALVLATSFSTVEVSSEQSDGECKGLLMQRGPNGLMDMINLPCLLAFVLEILLFK